MKNDQMPEGFLATREGGTAKIHLPEMVVTESHVFEPMLTRGAAQRVAEALWNSDVASPLERVVLVRDARYSDAAIEKFRERLWAVLVEGGVETEIEIEIEKGAPEAESAEPTPEPPASPAKAPTDTAAEPTRKAFVAPVSSRKRLGDRGKRERGTE